MAKRDPKKTARNKLIAAMTVELKAKLPKVLQLTGTTEHELAGIYGGKHVEFIDIRHAVIHTPEQFFSLWQQGYMEYLRKIPYADVSVYYKNFRLMQKHPEVYEWVELFLKRTFLRNFEALHRTRPKEEEAEIWIGQNHASYGLLVTPRFRNGKWGNDGSEVRHFPKDYWTIGHVLETGLVIPTKEKIRKFTSADDYLDFFEDVIVRNSGSKYEAEIASRYSDFVRNAPDPERVPLLVPEFRYAGLAAKHEYRLDFCVIDPFTMNRIGFELSPWSTHGELTGTAKKSQKDINAEAQANFEREMKKHKRFFKKHGVFVLIYTDEDLKDLDAVFADIARFLTPEKAEEQLQLTVKGELLAFKL